VASKEYVSRPGGLNERVALECASRLGGLNERVKSAYLDLEV